MAEEHQTSNVYATCLDKSGGVTSAMQACIADEFERQDKRLNAAYKALIGTVSEKRKTELRDVQRKW
ncbi:MAG: lysozyme inhibitor LprI family protein, partial [Pseudolabrys sp.]